MDEIIFLENVSIDNIYKTVLDLEGPRYPLDNLKELNEAADYIIEKLESYGVEVEVQEFYVYGFEEPFRNVIGILGDKEKPATIIGSHYDSVKNSQGANDNLSAVAVSLEIARVLSELVNPPSVRVVAFTLEECNPGYRKTVFRNLLNKRYIDEKGRIISLKTKDYDVKINKVLKKHGVSLFKYFTAFKEAYSELRETLNEEEFDYFKAVYDAIEENEKHRNSTDWSFLMGSYAYAKKITDENIKIASIINMDTLGWISQKPNTQEPLPVPEDLYPFTYLYKTERNSSVGNFLAIMGSKNSSDLLNKFLKNCKKEEIDLPYYGMNLPMEFDDIVKIAPDTLRSDHAPFWERGIPGIFITDTANFRSKYYHTGEDRYYHIDFPTLEKIAKSIILTLIE